jgi:Fe-S cluster biogenesis protein NfuA
MLEEQIKDVLEKIRPLLAFHRGDVDFVSFDEASGVAKVRLSGTCHGCPLAQLTLKSGIEEMVMQKVAGVTSVEAV